MTVAAVTGFAPGVFALMLLVMVTSQVIGGALIAESLAELLHWVTWVTKLVELVVPVALGPVHGPSVQCRNTVVVELRLVPLIVLTTVTVQVIPVVAPLAVPLSPLHWLIVPDAVAAASAA